MRDVCEHRGALPPRYVHAMKCMVMVYCDDSLLDALPPGAFDTRMHACTKHADELRG